MSDIQTRLDTALQADAPQARDPMFRVALMMRREQMALRRRILTGMALALGAAILAAFGVMALDQMVPDGPWLLTATAAVGVAVTAVLAAPHMQMPPALRRLAERWRPGL
ncbi:MAG: hypothetical protein WDN45_13560 [Caulobacteraceae bacterium]